MIRTRLSKAIAFVLTACFAVIFGFFWHDKSGALWWIGKYEYWLHFVAFALFLFAGIRFFRTALEMDFEIQPSRRWVMPAVLIFSASLVLLSSQPREFKIIMDEPVLLATALQMHELRESKTAAKAYEINGNFEILTSYIDKRPTFFPFIISQLHGLTGYRANQGIWFNTLLTPVFLSLLFVTGHLIWSRWGGYLVVLLFSTVPLLAMNMCGSGFELLNLTLLLATSLLAYLHLKEPSSASVNLLVMLAVLLAHTRYESALFVGAVGIVIVVVWWRQRQVNFTWGILVAPLLLVSIPLRRIIHADNTLLWQLDAKGVARPFSLEFVADNILHALNYLFAHDLGQPNSWLLSVLFVLALLCFLVLLIRRVLKISIGSPKMIASIVFGAAILFNFCLLMGYFWGQIDDVMATRIALPFILFQALFFTWVCSQIQWIKRRAPILMVLVGLYFVTVTRPLMASSNFLMKSIGQQEFQWTYNYIASRAESPILFISKRHMAALIQRRSALIPDTAIRSKLRIELHKKLQTFTEILIIEFLPYSSTTLEEEKQLVAEMALHFETETLVREKLNNHGEMRVSRILSVKMDELLRERALEEKKNLFNGYGQIKDFYRSLP